VIGRDAVIELRAPTVEDGAEVWRLIERIGGLERNTCYAYLLLCSHFADTCIVATADGALIGVVFAYRSPGNPDDLFVWQVGVAPEARGLGIARRMLEVLVERPACRSARFLTATVSRDNIASLALFDSVARGRAAPLAIEPGFASALFASPHPDENLIRIGPWPR
jgi:L-2,4-diaminobutyric acid acetyltransferase